MSSLTKDIRALRDLLLEGPDDEEGLDEGKRVKVKKATGLRARKKKIQSRKYRKEHSAEISSKKKRERKTSSYRQAQIEIDRLGPPKRGTRRLTNKTARKRTAPSVHEGAEYKAWMEDVNEAVDQFIGMPVDVLPAMPWARWFNSGLSAVKAAKNAVQMAEDIEDDEEDGEEFGDESELVYEEDDESEVEFTYQDWYRAVNNILKESGTSLEDLRKARGIKSRTIHSWYKTGMDPDGVAETILESIGSSRRAPSKRFEEERRMDDYVDVLGVKMRVKKQKRRQNQEINEKSSVSDEPPKEKTVFVIPDGKTGMKIADSELFRNMEETEIPSDLVAEAIGSCDRVIKDEREAKKKTGSSQWARSAVLKETDKPEGGDVSLESEDDERVDDLGEQTEQTEE